MKLIWQQKNNITNKKTYRVCVISSTQFSSPSPTLTLSSPSQLAFPGIQTRDPDHDQSITNGALDCLAMVAGLNGTSITVIF